MKGEDDRNSSKDLEKENVNSPDESTDDEELITLEEELEEPQTVPYPRERHAFPLACIIVGLFAVSILACFVYLFLYESKFDQTTELFKTVSAVLSGPLGFVLGFYFRVTETSSS